MTKAHTVIQSNSGFIKILVLFLIVIIIVVGSYSILLQLQNNNLKKLYTDINNTYQSLLLKYNNLTTAFSSQNNSLNAVDYNISNPYTKTLFNDHTFNLAKYNFTFSFLNSTSQYPVYGYNVTCGVFNYSFSAPYSGYLIFNASATIPNLPAINKPAAWAIYISKEPVAYENTSTSNQGTYSYFYKYLSECRLNFNSSEIPFTVATPLNNQNYIIPIKNGMNYLLIKNFNASPETITMNIKYIGYHYAG